MITLNEGNGTYYNEIDRFSSNWLRELAKMGEIAPGFVDERDIRDVKPREIERYTQCHFFAGIGVWSYALRLGGWPDEVPVWTGSCPCQPFSTAGRKLGFVDERHLWPAWFWLIRQCRPVAIFGEQVAGKNGEAWLDVVSNDLEREGYTIGSVVTAACGFGAPHMRKRIYWCAVGNADRKRFAEYTLLWERSQNNTETPGSSKINELGNSNGGNSSPKRIQRGGEQRLLSESSCPMRGENSLLGEKQIQDNPFGVADNDSQGLPSWEQKKLPGEDGDEERRATQQLGETPVGGMPGPTNGFWQAADWLFCRDGKWRPIEPIHVEMVNGASGNVGRMRRPSEQREYSRLQMLRNTISEEDIQQQAGGFDASRWRVVVPFPLIKGAGNRVGRLRGYGNAIVAQQAQAFIESFLSI